MGSTFKYIADSALKAGGGEQCHQCECTDKPIYYYAGEIIDPNKAKNVQLSTEQPDIDELCADCINGGNVVRSDAYEFKKTIETYANDKEYALAQVNLLPGIPLFMQGADWPMCCGEWCEFQGCPATYEESIEYPNKYRYWEHGPTSWEHSFELQPESLQEVSLFKCAECKAEYFTWQCT